MKLEFHQRDKLPKTRCFKVFIVPKEGFIRDELYEFDVLNLYFFLLARKDRKEHIDLCHI